MHVFRMSMSHGLNIAYRQQWLRDFLNRADLVFCDGAGVILGARILGSAIPQRITYADWMWQLAEFATPRDWSFFFLGGRPGVAQKAADRLKTRYPGLQIASVRHGYFDKTPGSAENEAVIRAINAAKPDLLIVGFGMPDPGALADGELGLCRGARRAHGRSGLRLYLG